MANPVMVYFLKLCSSLYRMAAFFKQDENTVTQVFDDMSIVSFTNLSNPVCQTGNSLCCFDIPEFFKNTGASCKISKNDGEF